MALEAYKDTGFYMGILISWVIERRFINFSCEGPIERRFLRIGGRLYWIYDSYEHFISIN